MTQDMQQRPKPSVVQQLEQRADEMAVTTYAITEGRRAMALIDKMNLLAARRRELSAVMEKKADELLARYEAAPAKVVSAFEKHNAQLDAEDAQLKEMEDALAKLGDNETPLAGSSGA